MALSFAASIAANIQRVEREINAKCYKISIELFLSIVRKTPSPSNPGKYADGLLANQWYPKTGDGFSGELGASTSNIGAASLARIRALSGNEFLGKNGRLSMANNLHYAYRAEVLGWPMPVWSGKSGSDGAGGAYRMVALALQEVAARHK